MTKNKKPKKFKKGTITFDVDLNEKFLCLYEPFIGRNKKEERRLIHCEKYDENTNPETIANLCDKYKAKFHEVIEKAHPHVRVMRIPNSQNKILDYIFVKNKIIEKYNHSQFETIEEFIKDFLKGKETIEEKFKRWGDICLNMINEGKTEEEIREYFDNSEEWAGFYRNQIIKINSYLKTKFKLSDYDKKLIELNKKREESIKYPESDFKIFKCYQYLYLVTEDLFKHLEFMDKKIEEFYKSENKEHVFDERFISLILIGEKKCGKTTLIRLLGPCNECNGHIDSTHISNKAPITLFNDHRPSSKDDNNYYLEGNDYIAFFGCNTTTSLTGKWVVRADARSDRLFVFTNNQPLNKLFKSGEGGCYEYALNNSLYIKLDHNVDLKYNNEYYKEFGKDNYISLENKLILNGPIKKWIYWDPKSSYYFREVLDIKHCKNEKIDLTFNGEKIKASELHGTEFKNKISVFGDGTLDGSNKRKAEEEANNSHKKYKAPDGKEYLYYEDLP